MMNAAIDLQTIFAKSFDTLEQSAVFVKQIYDVGAVYYFTQPLPLCKGDLTKNKYVVIYAHTNEINYESI